MRKLWLLVSLLLVLGLFSNSSNAVITSVNNLKEGDLISASDYGDPDIFIINSFGYKRLFLNPVIFNFYGHLGGFQKVRKVTSQARDSYITSGLFRNCETDDPKVYSVEAIREDEGNLHWVNISGEQAVKDDADFFKKVFCINNHELSWYPKSTAYSSTSQIPVYKRTGALIASEQKSDPLLCPDNVFDEAEQKDPTLCPGDNPVNNPKSVVLAIPSRSPMPSPSNTPQPSATLTPTPMPAPTKAPVSITWTKDAGVRLIGAIVPYVYKLNDGRYRMYYCGTTGNIQSAISSDGLSFEAESGVRLSAVYGGNETIVCDPTVVQLPDGRYRLYYKGANTGGVPAIHKIYSAISPDGLNFQREGLVIDSEKTGDNGWASVPEAIKLQDGRVRLYYVSATFGQRGGFTSAISDDGLNFTKEETKIYDYVDPSVTRLPDGRFLLIADDLSVSGGKQIYSFISEDGIHVDNASPQTIITESVADPAIVKVDDKTFRIYYWKIPDSPPAIYSITGVINFQ